MTLVDLLTVAQSAGIRLEARGRTLHVEAPAGVLTPALRAALVVLKPDLLLVLERLQAMRHLAAVAPRPLPYARAWAKGGPGHCFSCGDELDHPDAYGRCALCDIAADLFYAARDRGDAERVVM
jgi:hypothetical protein